MTVIEPLLAEGGIVFDLPERTEAHLQPDAVRFFLREAMPQLEEPACRCCCLPTGSARPAGCASI